MIDLIENFRWFVVAVLLSAILSALAWHLATRQDAGPTRRWSGVVLGALFIFYHPLSWIPAAHVLGLGVGMASAHGTPTSSMYIFTLASSLGSGAIAWLLTHLLKRAIGQSCKFVSSEA